MLPSQGYGCFIAVLHFSHIIYVFNNENNSYPTCTCVVSDSEVSNMFYLRNDASGLAE